MEKKRNGRINKNRIKRKAAKKKEHNKRLIKNGTMRNQYFQNKRKKKNVIMSLTEGVNHF